MVEHTFYWQSWHNFPNISLNLLNVLLGSLQCVWNFEKLVITSKCTKTKQTLSVPSWCIWLFLDRSQDEFVVSDENPDESEEEPPSNEDSDTDFCSRRLRRHPSRPMRQSRRLRRKTPKKKYSDDDEEEEESEENSRDSGKSPSVWIRATQLLPVTSRHRMLESRSCDMSWWDWNAFLMTLLVAFLIQNYLRKFTQINMFPSCQTLNDKFW